MSDNDSLILRTAVESTPEYILYTKDITDLEEILFPLQAEYNTLKAEHKYLTEDTVGGYTGGRIGWAKGRLREWQNGTGSNRSERISYYQGELSDAETRANVLGEDLLPPLETQIFNLNKDIDEIVLWRNAFVSNYEQNLAKGMGPEEAANAAAEETEFQTYTSVWQRNKTLLWTVGGIVTFAIIITIFFVMYKTKK